MSPKCSASQRRYSRCLVTGSRDSLPVCARTRSYSYVSRIAVQYLTLIFHQHIEAKDVITSKRQKHYDECSVSVRNANTTQCKKLHMWENRYGNGSGTYVLLGAFRLSLLPVNTRLSPLSVFQIQIQRGDWKVTSFSRR
jgi:hypothetical protein